MLKLKKTNPRIIKQIVDAPFKIDMNGYNKEYKTGGDSVKICIIGTGTPLHKDFNNIKDIEVFDEKSKDKDDRFGYSTMVAGMMSVDRQNSISGIVPKSEFYFAKAFSDTGCATQQSLSSSILWSVIKNIDLILLCGESGVISSDLSEVLMKASSNNICILMTSGVFNEKKHTQLYDNCGVFCIAHELCAKKSLSFAKKNDSFVVKVPRAKYYTTYAEDCYVKPPPAIYSMGVVGGLLSLIIAENKKNNTIFTPKSIYRKLFTIVLN